MLDRYPPRAPHEGRPTPTAASVATPSPAPSGRVAPPARAAAPPAPAQGPPAGLIRLDRPFDLDEFSRLLGETSIRLKVPRENLLEVLGRVLEFMGFGIYVYAISVRPAPAALLKEFEVELQRVDYSAERSRWEPFVERGSASSPPGSSSGSPP